MSDEVPHQYRPRLCHVVKWSNFQGYGFNLHAEKGKSGQFIGKIDESSPAEAAGLKDGDRIVEVNGVNIGNENHQQVVTRIKSGGEETRLLVVDADSDNWYKAEKRSVRGDLPEVLFLTAKRDEEENKHSESSGHVQVNGDNEQEAKSYPDVETVVSSVSAHVHNGSAVNEDDSHRPRLCHLKYWPHFEGFGFNLHAEKDKPGQYIGLVEANSPASTGGLRVNDRIIEVNGANVEKEKHADVIARIKKINGEVKLFVVDKETDAYYKKKGITVSSTLPQTHFVETPSAADLSASKRGHEYEEIKIDTHFDALQVSDGIDLDNEHTKKSHIEKKEISEANPGIGYEHMKTPLLEKVDENTEDALHELKTDALHELKTDALHELKTDAPPYSEHAEHHHQFTVAPPVTVIHDSSSSSSSTVNETDNLELNISVTEMKERLRSKKKQDPRLNKASFEEKFKEFQRM